MLINFLYTHSLSKHVSYGTSHGESGSFATDFAALWLKPGIKIKVCPHTQNKVE